MTDVNFPNIMNNNDSTEERVSSNSLTSSPVEEINMSYAPPYPGVYNIPSSHISNFIHDYEGYFPSNYYHTDRDIVYNTPHQHCLTNNDFFTNSSSPTSSGSFNSINNFSNNPYVGSTNDYEFYAKKIKPESEEEEEYENPNLNSCEYRLNYVEYQPLAFPNASQKSNYNEAQYNSSIDERYTNVNDRLVETQHGTNSNIKKSSYVKRNGRHKDRKRCSNCSTTQSPSWRRSINNISKGELLCNACGLYEKTAKRKRMLVTQDDGATKVVRKRDVRGYCCSSCGVKDATRWKRLHGSIRCDKCARLYK